eukprot:1601880-Pleurochrysis_carterae.AAC.8
MEEIDSRLRVGVGIESLQREAEKEFSLCANYPWGTAIRSKNGCSARNRAHFWCTSNTHRNRAKMSLLKARPQFILTARYGWNV